MFIAAFFLTGCPSAGEKPAKEAEASKKNLKVASTPKDGQQPAAQPGKAAKTVAPQEPKDLGDDLNTPLLPPGAGRDAAKDAGRDLLNDLEQVAEKPRDLGKPLVDDPAALVRLDPKQPIWLDKKNKHVVMLGEVCKAGYPLEFLGTYSNRSYEAVMSINVTPSIAHTALLATGAEPGHPAKFDPEFVPPTGTEVAIEVRWKDAAGKRQSAPAQHWIRNIKTKKQLDCNWVFAGSLFVVDEETGKKYYTADSGELICVLNLPTAMLDLPIRSYGAIEARSFEAFEEHLPPPGTPTTVLLKPILKGKPAGAPKPVAAEPPAANVPHPDEEQKAVAAAEPWLALVDQGQYARSWETAAEQLKNTVERRDFVRALNGSRKPRGETKSRQLESKRYTTKIRGMPNGKYVVLQYKTTFAKPSEAVETVVPMLDKDNKWRVADYYVK
jgi:hypothetical protein